MDYKIIGQYVNNILVGLLILNDKNRYKVLTYYLDKHDNQDYYIKKLDNLPIVGDHIDMFCSLINYGFPQMEAFTKNWWLGNFLKNVEKIEKSPTFIKPTF